MVTTTEGRSSHLVVLRRSEIAEEEKGIESELKIIDKNLNTFTVDNFNQLRSNIEDVGFNKAARDAKKDYHLIVTESNSTITSMKDEDLTITEDNRQRG